MTREANVSINPWETKSEEVPDLPTSVVTANKAPFLTQTTPVSLEDREELRIEEFIAVPPILDTTEGQPLTDGETRTSGLFSRFFEETPYNKLHKFTSGPPNIKGGRRTFITKY